MQNDLLKKKKGSFESTSVLFLKIGLEINWKNIDPKMLFVQNIKPIEKFCFRQIFQNGKKLQKGVAKGGYDFFQVYNSL